MTRTTVRLAVVVALFGWVFALAPPTLAQLVTTRFQTVILGRASTTSGTLDFYSSTSANRIRFQAGVIGGGNTTYLWPSTSGTPGQVIRDSDGNGALEWDEPFGGGYAVSGCGADQLFYRNTGSSQVDCNSGFTFVESTGKLSVSVATTGELLALGNNTTSSTSSPAAIDMGGTFSGTHGANPKLKIYDDGSVVYGLGVSFVSAGQLDHMIPASTSYVWYISAAEGMRLNAVRHVSYTTASPTINSCGTSPSIAGSDTEGVATVGTTPGATCTVTFGTGFTVAPRCICANNTSAQTCRASTSTTVLTMTSTLTAADKMQWICFGN